jgi:TonB-dependent receptor
MKHNLNIFALCFFLLAALAVHAQDEGTVAGTVVDRQTGDPLVGATIFLEGTNLGTICDLEGDFRLLNVPSGNYVLVSSMIGYQKTSIIGVQVTAGQTQRIEIALASEAIELDDEVVVEAKALRNTGASLLKERQKAAAVSDAISAEEISRSGSSDAAEAMTKVTGASVVDGKFVYIRGLGDRYSSVQLNGASLPSADPNKRAVPMDLFPSSLLDNIVTTKSFTPDKPGDFTGGSVNIGTKAFPDNFTLSVSASTSFNTQSSLNDKFLSYEGGELDWLGVDDGTRDIPDALNAGQVHIPDVGAAYNDPALANELDQFSKSFSPVMAPTTTTSGINQGYWVALGNQVEVLGRPFGFLGSLTYSNSSSFYDNGSSARWQLTSRNANTLTNNFSLNDASGSREVALGSLVTLSYKPAPTHELSITNMYNRSSDDVARYLHGSFPRDLEEQAVYETRVLQFTERQIQSLQLSGKHQIKALHDLRSEWSASSSSSTQDEPDLRFFTNNFVTNDNRPLRDANGELIRDENGEVMRGRVTSYSISPSIYPLPTRYFRELDESNREAQINFTLPFKQWQGINSNLKTGFLALKKERQFRERRYELAQDNIRYDGQPNTFFSGDKLGIISVSQEQQYRFGSYVQDATQLSSNFDGQQQVYAGYGMVELPINTRLRLVGGARLEGTRMDVVSQDSSKAEGHLSTDDILPSFNVVYALNQTMNLRASYGRTLARPNFRELAPFTSFNFVGDFIFTGNPQLRRTLVDNYDLRWESFGKPGEIYAVSLFFKNFQNPIERVILTVNGEIQFQNVERAEVAGIEFEGHRSLAIVNPRLEYFSAGGNLSLVRSEVSIGPNELALRRALDPAAKATRALQGQSPVLLNLDLSYDNYHTGTTAGLYYNFFGRRLEEVSLGGTPDVYEQARGTLDLTLAQKWGAYKIKFGAKNLLDSKIEKAYDYQGINYTASQYRKGRTLSLSFSYAIGR